ncbi:unnamed protein product, partial [Prorocentrum cordatum]
MNTCRCKRRWSPLNWKLSFAFVAIFDVDGGGLISVGVLERSLMKFDGSVFTEDTLGELLGAVPHGPGPYGEEAVSIKAFAVLVGSPEPPRRQRPRSAEARGVPLHARVGGALAFDLRGFREALVRAGGSAPPVGDHEMGAASEGARLEFKVRCFLAFSLVLGGIRPR